MGIKRLCGFNNLIDTYKLNIHILKINICRVIVPNRIHVLEEICVGCKTENHGAMIHDVPQIVRITLVI